MTVYGIPGTNTQTITDGRTEPAYVIMNYERPTMQHIAKEDGTWVIPPPSKEQVDSERDRRIAAGFTHGGKTYDSDSEAMHRVNKAYAVACRALVEGAKAGNLRWADAAQDFRWIAKDNSYVAMDAPTVIAFGEAAAAWETKHIYRARELKSMSPIPSDYTADKYWS